MGWFSNTIWIPDSPTIWILDKWTPSCFFLYWSGIQMVRLIITWDKVLDRPFEYWTIWNPSFKKFGIQMFLFFRWSVLRCLLLSKKLFNLVHFFSGHEFFYRNFKKKNHFCFISRFGCTWKQYRDPRTEQEATSVRDCQLLQALSGWEPKKHGL